MKPERINLNPSSGDDKRSLARSLIEAERRYTEEPPKVKKKKVFLSYSSSEENREENKHLTEELVRPVLEMLDFEVYSYNKNHSQRIKPMDWVEAQVRASDILVAFLTKDLRIQKDAAEEWHPKPNIPNEIGMAREKCLVIPCAEKGVIIPSNVEEKFHCPPLYKRKIRRTTSRAARDTEKGEHVLNLHRAIKNLSFRQNK